MVAMTRLDLVVGLAWIGLLTSVLLAQAVWVWWRSRWASSLARKSERLARSLRDVPVAEAERPARPADRAAPVSKTTSPHDPRSIPAGTIP